MKKWIKWTSLFVVVFITGMLTYRHWLAGTHTSKATPTSVKTKDRKILYWVAPMDPNYRKSEPGKSPMGMDLIPVYADQQTQDQDTVKISSQMINNLGIRT